MSKCNNEADIVDFGGLSNVKVEIIKMPNKGGCDLAYARFISRYLARESSLQASVSASSTVLFFVKDTAANRYDGRLRSLSELVRLALQRDDFVCGLEPHCWMSAYHDVKTLGRFIIDSYTRTDGGPELDGVHFNPVGYRDLSDFVGRELNWAFPNDEAIQVCYGGRFAITESRLLSHRAAMEILFKRLERALMEGSEVMNVVEHFVERLWAGILAKPLTLIQVKEILDLREFVLEQQNGHMGVFASENIQGCCKKIVWEHMCWDELSNRAQKAAQLLGFNEEIWDGDDDNVPIYSTPFGELTEDKREAVVYLGLRSYFKDDVRVYDSFSTALFFDDGGPKLFRWASASQNRPWIDRRYHLVRLDLLDTAVLCRMLSTMIMVSSGDFKVRAMDLEELFRNCSGNFDSHYLPNPILLPPVENIALDAPSSCGSSATRVCTSLSSSLPSNRSRTEPPSATQDSNIFETQNSPAAHSFH